MMRVSQLILGLVGITSLAFAAPSTPANDMSAFAASGEVVVCQNGLHDGPCAAAVEKRESNAGLILVADQAEERGNRQTINVATDDDNCAPVKEPVYWNIQSLYQWKGATCTYWKWDCGQGHVHDNMSIFTVDSRKDMQHLRYIPESFGDDRHRVGWIR